jgi:hypothetical protein
MGRAKYGLSGARPSHHPAARVLAGRDLPLADFWVPSGLFMEVGICV